MSSKKGNFFLVLPLQLDTFTGVFKEETVRYVTTAFTMTEEPVLQ